MKIFFLLALISSSAIAVETDLSGNIEGQFRHAKNNPQADEFPLFQDWDEENFYLLYGNVNGKVEFDDSRVEGNLFARYSQSELYEPEPHLVRGDAPYLATNIFTFPNRLVARDIFKLQHEDQEGNHKTESVLNKFYYEKEIGSHRLMFGRMYVNYGLGEIFNPINPFNQPTALTSVSQVAQGNDGASLTYFLEDNHNIQFLLLGDKRINNYDGDIDPTVWAHGEYQYSDKHQVDYVLGYDQKRGKIGGQGSHQFEEAMVFAQFLYRTKLNDDDSSEDLFDAMMGYDQQVTAKWHIRLEGGYQEQYSSVANPASFERFLPTEWFIALANVYEVHPLFKVSPTIINDLKSGFTYFIVKGTYSVIDNVELEAFGFSPVAKGDEADNYAQKLVTTDLGMSLRMFF